MANGLDDSAAGNSAMAAFIEALFAHPTEVPDERLRAFAQFAGSWDVEAKFYEEDGSVHETSAEWHFAPILGGRALQDVLIFPARVDGEAWQGRVGTTVRIFDEDAETWRIVWFSPASSSVFRLSGGPEGDQLVMRGDPGQGEETVWTFHSITGNSFQWEGVVSDDGVNWRTVQLMTATRRGQP